MSQFLPRSREKLCTEKMPAPRSIHQLIPVVSLTRLVTQVDDEALHVRHAHAKSSASLRDNIFFNHDAAEIVCAVLQRDLPNLLSLRDPRALNVWDVIQVNSCQRLHP